MKPHPESAPQEHANGAALTGEFATRLESRSETARTIVRYTPEYRSRLVALVRSGENPRDLAREYEASAGAIRRWVAAADEVELRGDDPLTQAEQVELRRLQQEIRRLNDEISFLKKIIILLAPEAGPRRTD